MSVIRSLTPTKVLVGVIVILAGQAVWQQRRMQALKYEMGFQQRHFDERVGQLAVDRLAGHRADVVAAVQWLHEYYKSDEGLRRSNGLWQPLHQQPDFEAIGAWIFDVYLNARVAGRTDEEAKQQVRDAIRSSDEWRRVHASG